MAIIYIIISILLIVYLSWAWKSTKSFEGNFTRISYIIIGTVFITLVTYIIFLISKRGINYPHPEMISRIRNIILLTFVPINGFITLPQIASTIGKIKNDDITAEQLKKKLIIFIIVVIITVIIECSYFKSIQNGILQVIKLK